MVFLKNGDMMESMCEAKDYDFDKSFPYMGGALGGHQMAGSILLVWGIWQSLNIFYYYSWSRKSGQVFQSRSWYHLCNFPLEPIIKIILPPIASIAEVTGGFKWYRPMFDGDGLFQHTNVYQHISMFMGFAISGLVDLIGMYVPLPEGTEQSVMTLSFINYAILVDFHLANPKLAQDTHILVLWSALASAAFMGVQILFPNSILLSLGRGFTMILQGAWWHIIGHILFDGDRFWHPCYMGSVMMVSMTFSFTMMTVLLAFIITFALVAGIVYYCFPTNIKLDEFAYSRVSGGQGDQKGAVEMARMEGGPGDEYDEDSKQLMSKF